MDNRDGRGFVEDGATQGGTVAGAPLAGGAPDETGDTLARSEAGRRRRMRGLLLAGVAAVAIGVGGYEAFRWWTFGRFEVSTDDAYVHADTTLLAAKVSGYVTAVEVADNQPVKTGDVIARIDDGDYRLAVQAAQDKIAVQQAALVRIGEQMKAAQAAIDQATAQVAASKADLERATLEFDRQSKLAESNFASRQAFDNARTDRDRAGAAVASANAGVASAQANLAVLDAQRVEAQRVLGQYRTDLARAERDLSFTVVRAPVDGVVGNRSVEVGQLVQPGAALAAIVPLDGVYVDANYKETQLKELAPGQRVEVAVDAYPGRVFPGVVASISPASGAVFSLLPPENATGNFTKIVQRVPVRVRFLPEVLRDHVLRPGMSVVATVDTLSPPVAADTLRTLARR